VSFLCSNQKLDGARAPPSPGGVSSAQLRIDYGVVFQRPTPPLIDLSLMRGRREGGSQTALIVQPASPVGSGGRRVVVQPRHLHAKAWPPIHHPCFLRPPRTHWDSQAATQRAPPPSPLCPIPDPWACFPPPLWRPSRLAVVPLSAHTQIPKGDPRG